MAIQNDLAASCRSGTAGGAEVVHREARVVGEDKSLEGVLESFLKLNDSPATDSPQDDAVAEKSPGSGQLVEGEIRLSELVLWSGRAGLSIAIF